MTTDISANGIHIRLAEEADFPQLVALYREFATFEKLPHRMINTVEKMKAEKDLFHCYVAETPAKHIAGYVSCFHCYYTWSGKSFYMDDLYIQPAYRGQGLGTRLVETVIAYAKDSGCGKLRWQVSNWNTQAIAFYKSLGAEIDNVERNCDLVLG